MNDSTAHHCRAQRGFTLIEVLVAAALVGLFVVPAMQALSGASHLVTQNRAFGERLRHLEAKAETVLADSFANLAAAAGNAATATAYSDPPGDEPRRLVYVSRYDGDASGLTMDPFDVLEADADLLWVRIAFEGDTLSFTTLVRR